jgi:hypothetical protein
MTFAFALADGAFIFLAFLVVAFFGIVLGYYTKTGGIGEHPYDKIYSGAPGSRSRSETSGRDPRERMNWSRGTR